MGRYSGIEDNINKSVPPINTFICLITCIQFILICLVITGIIKIPNTNVISDNIPINTFQIITKDFNISSTTTELPYLHRKYALTAKEPICINNITNNVVYLYYTYIHDKTTMHGNIILRPSNTTCDVSSSKHTLEDLFDVYARHFHSIYP